MASRVALIERDQMYAGLIRRFARDGRLTPEAVEYFAALLAQDDHGSPMRPAAHHRLWLKLLTDERIKRLLIIAPPGTGKTSWIISGFLAARVSFFPESNNIIVSADSETAAKRSMVIRNMTDNPIWRYLFPNILPASGMKWEQVEWSLAPNGQPFPGRIHPTMRSYGVIQAIAGSRADLLVGDDILSYEIARSPVQRKTLQEWFDNSFLSRLKVDGRVVMIGTAYNSADLYAELRKNPGWTVLHMPMLSEQEDGYYYNIRYADDYNGKEL